MNNPKISIIVPVYNMERYLEECLESIKAQTFTDWECLVVNDGSADRSLEIMQKIAEEDSRFRVIDKSNGGLSSARNAGLREIKGKYVGFVDSDDWIEPKMFETLYLQITKNDADIAQVGFWKEFKNAHRAKQLTDKVRTIDGKTAIQNMAFDKIPNYVWNKLHRRDIINCEFPVGRNFEDLYVYSHWLRNVKKMVIDPTPLYHYRMRKGSIIHSSEVTDRYDYFHSCIDSMESLKHTYTNEHDINKRHAYLNKVAVAACKYIARHEKDVSKRREAIIKISDEVKAYQLPSLMKTLNFKIWMRAKLLRKRPVFFSKLMIFVHYFDFSGSRREKQFFD